MSSILMGGLAVSSSVLADTQAKSATVVSTETKTIAKDTKPQVSKEQDKSNKKAISDKAESQKGLLKEVHKGASEAFWKVVNAVKFINDGKEKEAIKALQDATGKFDVALAADPNLGLLPVASTVKVTELLTTPEAIKAQVSIASKFLKDSKVQATRALIMPLQDDLTTKTTYLPMTTYPDAIKLATKMLIEGKKDAALATLETAFSTTVEEVSVIPLSLLRAEAMILAASELDKEKDKEKVLVLLTAAQNQLEVAVNLGYTSKNASSYEGLTSQIKALKKEVKGANIVEKLYSKIKSSFKDLINIESKQATKK